MKVCRQRRREPQRSRRLVGGGLQAGDNGWAIGAGEEYTDLTYQDDVESRSIYDLIEQEIVPLFYTRTSDGLPRGWLRTMKQSMQMGTSFFNTHRMVGEYVEKCYWPSEHRYDHLIENQLQRAQALAQWRRRLRKEWPQLRIDSVDPNSVDFVKVDGSLAVKAKVNLGNLTPDDVAVQLFHGLVDSFGDIPSPETVEMSCPGAKEGPSGSIPASSPSRQAASTASRYAFCPRTPTSPTPTNPG